MAYVIAVLNPKGGPGKSTLATNLARAVQLEDHRVLIADTDKQGTARDWRETQGEDMDLPSVFGVGAPTLEKDIPDVAHAFDCIIIDGAAKSYEVAVSAVKTADLVLIPIRPSAADIWGVEDLVEIIKTRQSVTDGTPQAAFVISQAIVGTKLAADIGEVLDNFGLPVLDARLHLRVAYSEALASGLSVLDYEPAGKAAGEIRAILEEVQSRYTNGRA